MLRFLYFSTISCVNVSNRQPGDAPTAVKWVPVLEEAVVNALHGPRVRLGGGVHELADEGDCAGVVHGNNWLRVSSGALSDPLTTLMLGYSAIQWAHMLKQTRLLARKAPQVPTLSHPRRIHNRHRTSGPHL